MKFSEKPIIFPEIFINFIYFSLPVKMENSCPYKWEQEENSSRRGEGITGSWYERMM